YTQTNTNTMTDNNNILQFKEFSGFVNISFWHELSQKKLDVFKLSDAPVPINAYYTYATAAQLDPFLNLEYNSFLPYNNSSSNVAEDSAPSFRVPPKSIVVGGTLYNYNTKEDFKAAPKVKLFEDTAKAIWDDIMSGEAERDPLRLNRYLLLTFADIKNHTFYYMFGIPALSFTTPITVSKCEPITQLLNEEQIKSLKSQAPYQPFFLLQANSADVKLGQLSQWNEFYGTTTSTPIVGFCDPCNLASNPGWPLRNLLYMLAVRHNVKEVTVVCLRDTKSSIDTSIVLTVSLPEQSKEWSGKSVGWEKDTNGKILPRSVSLASTMDPLKLATQSVDLNLKLMRWRILPALNLELIQNTKCLLLGAGTLGCNVARCLMSWGVRNITFVDSGKVSYSNPVRQTLFTFNDCIAPKGKDKALAAAESLKLIFPAMNSKGVIMSIPMPGHSVPENVTDQVRAAYDTLVELVEQHDVIFLLTDSRESRWLPTLLGRANNKLVINSALGFDSFLVGRHGVRTPHPDESPSNEGADLGCYFCNDVIAPSDTLKDRTLGSTMYSD
ncbi:hypothetical protein SAMD00019534_007270, partial [Acytostelium subglobosum LB1]|uniref:hypothetical protein n=1 Tax=Acytostelium subglobosum LB1 TaxID=1410327 RepID=UPI000644B18E